MSSASTNTSISLNISATFTAEPLEPALKYWFERLNLEVTTHFAPYNQVFQSLLDPSSPFLRDNAGLNVLLIRPEDWQRFGATETAEWKKELTKNTNEFIEALQAQATASPSRYLVIVTDPSSAIANNPEPAEHIAELSNQIVTRCQELGITAATNQTLSSFYPTENHLDEIADREGHIPYTEEFFNALSTLIARRLHSIVIPAPKVIIVDGDNTLWPEVAAETGPENLTVTQPYQNLQHFLKARQRAGTILCLASKNEEKDVHEVFAR